MGANVDGAQSNDGGTDSQEDQDNDYSKQHSK